MDEHIRQELSNIHSDVRELQGKGYRALLEARNGPVDWAYEIWDDIVKTLTDGDNRQRSIAAQILCNLAQSDPKNRMLEDFDKLLAVTKDERFVTARHCMLAIWKVGVVGK